MNNGGRATKTREAVREFFFVSSPAAALVRRESLSLSCTKSDGVDESTGVLNTLLVLVVVVE